MTKTRQSRKRVLGQRSVMKRYRQVSYIAPIYKTEVRLQGAFKFALVEGTQTFVGDIYNPGSQPTAAENIWTLTSLFQQIAGGRPNISKLVSIYDQYRVDSIVVSARHAGTIVQDDATVSTTQIPTPVAIGMLFDSTSVVTTSQLLGAKPSALLALNDQILRYSFPTPNVYKDYSGSQMTLPLTYVYLAFAPLSNATNSLEYYIDVCFNMSFTKQDSQLATYPALG